MRVIAFADLHGRHWNRARALIRDFQPDWIILAGDLLPSFDSLDGGESRVEAQLAYWRDHRKKLMAPGIPTLLARGNHEPLEFPVEGLNQVPQDLGRQVLGLEGVPSEFCAFGHAREFTVEELQAELDTKLADLELPRVVVSHTPPFGILDEPEPGAHVGHRPLSAFLHSPAGASVDLVICGHVHEGFGIGRIGNAKVLNVATGFAELILGPDGVRLIRLFTFEDLLAFESLDS